MITVDMLKTYPKRSYKHKKMFKKFIFKMVKRKLSGEHTLGTKSSRLES